MKQMRRDILLSRRSLTLWAFLAVALLASPVAFSQEESSDTDNTVAAEDEDSGDASDSGEGEDTSDEKNAGDEDSNTEDAIDEDDEPKPLREQTIYIPYNRIRGIFEKEGRGVFIPYEQFQKLWKQARQAAGTQPEDPEPPIDSLITEINSSRKE